MGFNDEYLALRKKRKNDFSASAAERQAAQSADAIRLSAAASRAVKAKEDDDIAPVRLRDTELAKEAKAAIFGRGNDNKSNENKTDERKWFQKGAFEDGYQFGDVTKTILGTDEDLGTNVMAGILGIGEKAFDASATLMGGIGSLFGADEFAETAKEVVERDLYDEEKIANKMINFTPSSWTKKLLYGDEYEENSIFGEKSDALAQSAGQLAGTVALQSVGVPWFVTSGVTSFGSEAENAFNQGANYGEAITSATISAGAEILTEKLFGGSGLGEKGLINTSGLTKGISNKVVKLCADYGINMISEGGEEVATEIFNNLGSALYKEENAWELLTNEEALDGYLESFIGGMALGGGANVSKVVTSAKTGRDYNSGLTTNEQKVVDAEVQNRIDEAEKDGKELTKKEKAAIEEQVLNDLKKGYISTDVIESVLGGETYKSYQDTIANEDATIKELSEMYEGAELEQAIKDITDNSKRNELRELVGKEVSELAVKNKDNFLAESYNERTRRTQAFTADLSKYEGKTQETIKKAVESGILNNTNRTHEFVDMVAKISADKGVSFDFTNNAKLKETGFAVADSTVNGYVTSDGITVNIDSSKALNSIVGHEITHVLEGTELYDALQEAVFEYAKTKGEYMDRLKNTRNLYKDLDGYKGVDGFKAIKREVVSDLVGDYLFTDADFVNNLSTKHRNVFQKIYDEIKYLYKTATAGSKEARELEKAKKIFEKAYRAGGDVQKNTVAEDGVRYSISRDIDGSVFVDVTEDIFDKNSGESVARTIQRVIHERFNNLIDVHGQKIQINKTTNDEFRYSDSAKTLLKYTPQIYNDKLKTIANADEILSAAKNWIGEENKHTRADDIVEFARGNVSYRVGGNGYVADVIVGIRKNGAAVLYDLVNICNKKITEAPHTMVSDEHSQRRSGASANINISQTAQNVKRKTSLSENAQTQKRYGDYNVSGEDIKLDGTAPTQDIVPKNTVDNTVAEEAPEVATESATPTADIAPSEPSMKRAEPRMKRADSKNNAPHGKEERSFIETATGSEAVDGVVTPDDIPDALRYYEVKSNKKSLDVANRIIEKNGFSEARKHFNNRMESEKITAEDMALGQRLIQEAAKAGDAQACLELLVDTSIIGTEYGQVIQAMSMIRRLSPEGQLRALTRMVERGKTRGDKSFDGVEVTEEMAKKILKTYKEDGTFDQTKLDAAVEDVKQQIADKMKVTKLEKVNAWRYLSMLGNPKTHARNIVSNAANFVTRMGKNAIARTVEDIAPVVAPKWSEKHLTRTKTWAGATNEVKAFAKQTTKEQEAAIKGDNKYSEESSLKEKRKIFNTKAIEWYGKKNSAALEAEDALFSKPTYEFAFSEYLTANGIKTKDDIMFNPEIVEKAKNYALEEARRATFRQNSYLAKKIGEIERKNPLYGVVIGSTMPFKKTPINVAKTGLAYSPLGIARNIYDAVKVHKGEMDASEAIDHIAQTVTGTSLAVAGFFLASLGVLNGAGSDDKEGKYDYQLGKQTYSFNFGGDSYSLSWLSPVAMPLFVGANAYEQLVEGEEWDMNAVIDALGQTLDPLSEMSFVSSLDDVLSSYDNGFDKILGAGESMVQNYATQFIPTLSSQIASIADTKKRSTQASRDSGFTFGEETLRKIAYKIPGLRNTLEPTTDIWGNEVEQSENILVRALDSLISPANKREGIETEIDEEIKDLYRQTGDAGLIPSIPYSYFNYDGEKYEMSADEYTEFKQEYGQTAYSLLETLFDTDTYRYATSEERAEMVNKIYDYARDEARKSYLAGLGVDFANATAEGEEYYKENPIVGALEADLPVDEYTFSVEYPEKYEFFKENGISYETYSNADEDGKRAYTWAYENPGKYTLSKAITDDFMEYYSYKSEMNDFDAKDENGETVSGLKKERVSAYINGLDLDYGQKMILYRSMYDSKEDQKTYNKAIVEYLNSRDDISYEQGITILKELGMTVSSDGTVTW